ncbi:MAG TPA: ABC transporter permease [Microcoleaceae cyanobacterium]|jgi:ABC-2 type transport system permease protein
MLRQLFSGRFWALVLKEIRQILRNKQLLVLLIVPPTLQLLIYGFALNPDVHHLRLGVVDYAQTATSRSLIAAFTENQIFDPTTITFDEKTLTQQVETGDLTVGLVIPPDFSRTIANGESTTVQVFIDGVDANTAGIANGYINQIVQQFSRQQLSQQITPLVSTQVIFFYNPGLTSSWFFVPGVMGLVVTLIGSIVSSITVVKEKDTGTLEQLLMTPAAAWEVLLAKVVPLFILLMGDVLLALTIGRTIFGVPFRGSFLLFMVLSGLYVFVGIGVGILLATLCQSQQQVVLTTFFINLPMVQLSGAIAPIETMPKFFQYLSIVNPLRHYIAIIRGILLKGVGLEALWVNVLALACFAVVLLTISIKRFRNQLS